MPSVIDISKTHGMGTARVIEQFGFPRCIRKFITDHVDWLTTKVYFDKVIDVAQMQVAVSSLVRLTPFLRARHIIDGDKDLLILENFDPDYDYLKHGTSMMQVKIQNMSAILTTSHVVTDLKSSYLIGKDLESIYHGEEIFTNSEDLKVFHKFTQLFEKQTDTLYKPFTWRFLNIAVEKIHNCYSKEDYLLKEMQKGKVTELTFEEICNTSHLFETPIRGCTTIATLLRTIAYNPEHSDIANLREINQLMKQGYSLQNIQPNTFTSKYVYNFIRTDKVFNSILTHLLLSSSEIPPFVYKFFVLFLPMKNDTTKQVKIVFQNKMFGSIIVNITLH